MNPFSIRPAREAPWSHEYQSGEISASAQDLLDEILGRVAWHGEESSTLAVRALLEEQLYAKKRAIQMVERMISHWDDGTLVSNVQTYPTRAGSSGAPQSENRGQLPPHEV